MFLTASFSLWLFKNMQKNNYYFASSLVSFLVDVCANCNHLVAEHEYTFRVEGQYQVLKECEMW